MPRMASNTRLWCWTTSLRTLPRACRPARNKLGLAGSAGAEGMGPAPCAEAVSATDDGVARLRVGARLEAAVDAEDAGRFVLVTIVSPFMNMMPQMAHQRKRPSRERRPLLQSFWHVTARRSDDASVLDQARA